MERSVDSIIAELDRIFVDQFELAAEAVTPDARLREDLDLDSLDAADMLIAIEKRFGVRLDDDVTKSFRTVGDIHNYVHALVSEKRVADTALGADQAAD